MTSGAPTPRHGRFLVDRKPRAFFNDVRALYDVACVTENSAELLLARSRRRSSSSVIFDNSRGYAIARRRSSRLARKRASYAYQGCDDGGTTDTNLTDPPSTRPPLRRTAPIALSRTRRMGTPSGESACHDGSTDVDVELWCSSKTCMMDSYAAAIDAYMPFLIRIGTDRAYASRHEKVGSPSRSTAMENSRGLTLLWSITGPGSTQRQRLPTMGRRQQSRRIRGRGRTTSSSDDSAEDCSPSLAISSSARCTSLSSSAVRPWSHAC